MDFSKEFIGTITWEVEEGSDSYEVHIPRLDIQTQGVDIDDALDMAAYAVMDLADIPGLEVSATLIDDTSFLFRLDVVLDGDQDNGIKALKQLEKDRRGV